MPVAAWMAVIFTLSSLPASSLPHTTIPHIDKLVHVLEYLLLGYLLARALSGPSRKNGLAKIIISAIIIASLCAIIDEWHQQYIQGRTCDIFDFLADFIGAGIGVSLYGMKGRDGRHKAL